MVDVSLDPFKKGPLFLGEARELCSMVYEIIPIYCKWVWYNPLTQPTRVSFIAHKSSSVFQGLPNRSRRLT